MRADCKKAVEAALGRDLKTDEARGIQERIVSVMRRQAARDPGAWRRMGAAERLRQSADIAAQGLVAEAQLKLKRAAQQAQAGARIRKYLDERIESGVDGLDALMRMLVFHPDTKGRTLSIESQANAIRDDAVRQMLDTLEASDPRIFGLLENRAGVEALVRELHGEDSGSQMARTGAKAFKDVAAMLRERFNRSGGQIGHLEDWGLPHHHSQARVATAGAEKWTGDVMRLIDRRRYRRPDGEVMNDEEISVVLREAFMSIATNGVLDVEAGKYRGDGTRANRHRYHREIHFKNAQAYIDYQRDYGERGLYDVMLDHVTGLARDIALVETLGPNTDAQLRYWLDTVEQESLMVDPTKAGRLHSKRIKAQGYYDYLAGRQPPVASLRLAQVFDTIRNTMVASKLGSAVITSFSDEATMGLTARTLKMPALRMWANELAALNPADPMERRLANRAGLALNGVIADVNRFGNDNLRTTFSSRLAGLTIRASGLAALTDARRRAFGRMMLSALAQVTRDFDSVSALEASDQRILAAKGITDADFAVWKLAQPEDWGDGVSMLTPDAINRIADADLATMGDPLTLKQQAITRLLGVVSEETSMAVVEPGARERAIMTAGLQRGTWKGELTRSFFLFKSFPIAVVLRHVGRAWDMPTGTGRALYLAALIAGTTALGAASLQVNELLSGRDPRNMDPTTGRGGGRFWIQAMLKGGALGLYGDFLLAENTQFGQSPIAALAGPVAGLTEDVLKLTVGNLREVLDDKDTRIGAELVRFGRSNLPGANLWYTKAALDHLIVHQLQEMFSPGYLNRVKARGAREFGQRWWWEPGETMPSRAPDLAAVSR